MSLNSGRKTINNAELQATLSQWTNWTIIVLEPTLTLITKYFTKMCAVHFLQILI